jgi:hypothetical protein
VLDRVQTDDRAGFWYLAAPTKRVRIPSRTPPGRYEFVQEVVSGRVASCSSSNLLIVRR